MICHQNWHKEEERSNYDELTMLSKAAISVLGSFRETRALSNRKLQFVNTQSQRKLETPKFKHSALGLKFRFFFSVQLQPPALFLVTYLPTGCVL